MIQELLRSLFIQIRNNNNNKGLVFRVRPRFRLVFDSVSLLLLVQTDRQIVHTSKTGDGCRAARSRDNRGREREREQSGFRWTYTAAAAAAAPSLCIYLADTHTPTRSRIGRDGWTDFFSRIRRVYIHGRFFSVCTLQCLSSRRLCWTREEEEDGIRRRRSQWEREGGS